MQGPAGGWSVLTRQVQENRCSWKANQTSKHDIIEMMRSSEVRGYCAPVLPLLSLVPDDLCATASLRSVL